MRLPHWPFLGALFLLVLAQAATAQDQAVQVAAGPGGAAQITLASGKKITIPKERGQTGISDPRTAQDGRTVGWLVEYDDGVSYPVPGTLIVWRSGKIIGRFADGPVFWSWTFVAGGAQVAYHTGPLHGEETSHCELHDVESGRLISKWDGDLDSDAKRPAWTKGLDH